MVNRAIMDLAVSIGGQDTWAQICRQAGLPFQSFSNTTVYDDAVTYDLVAAAADVLDLDPADVLEQFGRHWILFTGREGWGPLFDMAGDTLLDFVEGLDTLHARVQASMPECRMPSFSVTRADDGVLTVAYQSDRHGLAPMVLGLLGGLAEHFDEDWEIEHLGPAGDAAGDGQAEIFSLRPLDAAVGASRSVGTV
ncbi:MAG: heme NO-binding domain-containing protein [Actinomycetota bacterium]